MCCEHDLYALSAKKLSSTTIRQKSCCFNQGAKDTLNRGKLKTEWVNWIQCVSYQTPLKKHINSPHTWCKSDSRPNSGIGSKSSNNTLSNNWITTSKFILLIIVICDFSAEPKLLHPDFAGVLAAKVCSHMTHSLVTQTHSPKSISYERQI